MSVIIGKPLTAATRGLSPEIVVTAPALSTIDILENSVIVQTYTLTGAETQHTFYVPLGTYVVRATLGVDTASKNITVDVVAQYSISLISSNIVTGTRNWSGDGWGTTWDASWYVEGTYEDCAVAIVPSTRWNGMVKTLNVSPNTDYTFSIWAKTNSTINLNIAWDFNNATYNDFFSGDTTNWKRYSATRTAPSGATTLRVRIEVNSSSTRTLYSAGYMVSTDGSIAWEPAQWE